MVWEGGGFAKRCYWSLYSWNNLYGLATAASSLINVCQKPGSGLLGVKALRNNASHHQQEWQTRRKEKEDGEEVGQRERRRHESRMIEARGGWGNCKSESNFWDPHRRQITWGKKKVKWGKANVWNGERVLSRFKLCSNLCKNCVMINCHKPVLFNPLGKIILNTVMQW